MQTEASDVHPVLRALLRSGEEIALKRDAGLPWWCDGSGRSQAPASVDHSAPSAHHRGDADAQWVFVRRGLGCAWGTNRSTASIRGQLALWACSGGAARRGI